LGFNLDIHAGLDSAGEDEFQEGVRHQSRITSHQFESLEVIVDNEQGLIVERTSGRIRL
jgi:hypothetical protein